MLATLVKDSLVLGFPLLFVSKITQVELQTKLNLSSVLGSLAQRLDGQPVSDYGSRVQFAMGLGPTVFPIVFAAIAGKALRSIAQMRLEKGDKVGVRRV